jgi:hypothetical protein
LIYKEFSFHLESAGGGGGGGGGSSSLMIKDKREPLCFTVEVFLLAGFQNLNPSLC